MQRETPRTPHPMLDREQREALRGEIHLLSSGWGDLQLLNDGWRELGLAESTRAERQYVLEAIEGLRRMVELLDLIGWTEQPEAPAEQPVSANAELASWAQRQAREVSSSAAEHGHLEEELDVYGALCAIGGEA